MNVITSMVVEISKSGKTFRILTTYGDGTVMRWGRYVSAEAAQAVINTWNGVQS